MTQPPSQPPSEDATQHADSPGPPPGPPAPDAPAPADPAHPAPPPPGYRVPQGGYAAPAPGYPFAPVPRPPREPWVNPSRRLHLAGAGTLVALAFLGGGIGIGLAVADSGPRDGPHYGPARIERIGPGEGYPGRVFAPYGKGNQRGPGGQGRHAPGFGAPSSPAPSPSSTS